MTETLPALQDAMLDEATVDRLFADVANGAELLEIVLKGGAAQLTPEPNPTSLAAARGALREGRVFGVQLRYRFAGTEWWDTLIATRAGVRLVRIDRGAALAAALGSCE